MNQVAADAAFLLDIKYPSLLQGFIMKKCITCGKNFSETRSDQMFCSPKCRYRYYHPQKDYLILPIKKQWFDMISAGEKTEEYREIKPYWDKRFKEHFGWNFGGDDIFEWHFDSKPKQILFRNGYSENAPSILCECTIRIGTGKEEWGAEKDKEYYVLEIRKII